MYAVAQWLRGLRPVRYLIVVCGRCGRLAFLRVPLLGCEECPGYPPQGITRMLYLDALPAPVPPEDA